MDTRVHVCCMMQNALNWRSRYRNYEMFHDFITHSKGFPQLYTAEIAFGDTPHVITRADEPWHNLQLRTDCELWNKEGAIDLLIQRLPADAEYIAWFDADVTLTDNCWAKHVVDLLQHYDVVQLFSHTQDLGTSFQPVGPILKSYYYRYVEECGRDMYKLNKNKEMITGLAWAARKSVLSKVGMLPDWCVMSSCDRHIAAGFIGNIEDSFGHGKIGLNKNFVDKTVSWGQRAYNVVRGNVSYLPGLLLHYWHGERRNRGYVDRWKLMRDYDFNPDTDIVRDYQGLYRWAGNKPALRDAFRELLHHRNEDEQGEKLLP